MSAKDGEYDQADGLDLGADGYLVKPFPWVVFVAQVRAVARRGAVPDQRYGEPDRELVSGDLVLRPASRTASRGGTEIALTAREFALLEHLVSAGGRVVSKTELLAARLGRPGARRPERRRGVRRLPAAQDRSAVREAVAADRPRSRLPARARRPS